LLLCCWRSLTDWDLRRRLQELQVEARRCFRIARSTANLNLASEHDAIGRDFDEEAAGLTSRMQTAAYQIYYPGFENRKRPKSFLFTRPIDNI